METSFCAYMSKALEIHHYSNPNTKMITPGVQTKHWRLLTRREPFLIFALYCGLFELCVYLNNSRIGWLYIVLYPTRKVFLYFCLSFN